MAVSQVTRALAGLVLAGAPAASPAQATPEDAIRAFFAAGSGIAGRQPIDELPRLFVPAGRLITVAAPDSTARAHVRTPEEYVTEARTYLATSTQFEVPTRMWVEQYANVGSVFCAFEARRAPDGQPFYRGVASFQLLRVGTDWRILSAYWQGERPSLPLPARYAPP
jgi:hypothetical protein